jgi:hypothetical protein
LQISVDALRDDLPERYSNVLGDGGFRYQDEFGLARLNSRRHEEQAGKA